MAKQLSTVATTDTFLQWVNKTNDIVVFCNTEVMTANSNANGSVTTGNAALIGIFSANTIAAGSALRGGNVQSSANLTVVSNAVFTNAVVANNGVTLRNSSLQDGFTYTSTGTTLQTVDTFPAATYRTAKYIISINDNGAAAYQSTEIMVLHNGTTAWLTEYATMVSGSTLAQFEVDVSGGNVRLRATPSVANSTMKLVKTLIPV